MKPCMNLAREFLQDEQGAAAVEYALLVALIAAVMIAALGTLGQNISRVFETVAAKIK